MIKYKYKIGQLVQIKKGYYSNYAAIGIITNLNASHFKFERESEDPKYNFYHIYWFKYDHPYYDKKTISYPLENDKYCSYFEVLS